MTSLPPAPDAAHRVTALASDGDGIARTAEGRVVFVEGAVPGDLVELTPPIEQRKVLRARIARIVEASPDRVAPRCVYFGRCGGCLWQNVRYEAQLEAKRKNVRAALERIGGLSLVRDVEIVASPNAYHYRARTRVVEVPGGVGYRRRGSAEALRIDDCPVLVPAVQSALAAHSRAVAEAQARSEHEGPERSRVRERGGGRSASSARGPREWVITAGSRGPARVDAAVGGPGRDAADHERAAREETVLEVLLEVLGERLRIGGPGFVQGNALLWDRLAREVRDLCLVPVAGRTPRRFVELYAGSGFFTLPLARSGLSGIAVESDRRSIDDLVFNLARAELGGSVEAIAGQIERREELPQWLAAADLLLVDPPRIGLEGGVRDAIAEKGPAAVVYVSCDPATLARDLKVLVGRDYRLSSVLAFDLFPQTPHVETVVRLER